MPLVEKPIHKRLRMRDPHPTLAPHSLDALPEHRQLNLLWHVAGAHTRAEVEELMTEFTTRACPVPVYQPAWFTAAVLGDDGLHHLWHPDNGMVCSKVDTTLEGPWVHRATFRWKDEGKSRQRTYITNVSRSGDEVPPEMVPPGEECWLTHIAGERGQGSLFWPKWMDVSKPYVRARWSFAQELGRGCAICGGGGVGFMDHDQFTGWVRGMLCGNCNNLIDMCPHVTGCQFGDYLNNPPAWHLMADYAGLGNKYKDTRARLAKALDPWEPMMLAEIRRREPQREALFP